MFSPAPALLTYNKGHDDVRYAHSEAIKDGNLPLPKLVQEEEGWNISHKLTDVYHSAQAECRLIFLAKSSEEGRCIVNYNSVSFETSGI